MYYNLKIKRNELFYFVALFMQAFANTVISNSYLFGKGVYRFTISNYILYTSALLFLISFCLKQTRLAYILLQFSIGIIALVVADNISSIGFGVSVLAIIASVNIDFKKIVKWCLFINCFCLVIVIMPSLIGIIPNETYSHFDSTAYSLGFSYYSNAPYIIFMITILGYWLLRTKKQEKFFLLFSSLIQYIVYKICTVRLIFYLYIVFLILVFMSRWLNIEKKHKIITFLSAFMFPVAVLITVIGSLKVNTSSFWTKINEFFNSRLIMNFTGFMRYGVKLLGQKIETSQEYWDLNHINHYFYIDSAYAYILICYGIIFSFILITAYSVLSYYAAKTNNIKLLIWCIVICVFSLINNIIFNISLNPLPILAINILLDNAIRRKKRLEAFQIKNY
jgi:hypothetical protein